MRKEKGGPEEQVEAGGSEEVVGSEQCWHGGRTQGPEELGRPLPTELAGQHPGQDHRAGPGERRPQPQSGKRDTECPQGESGHERGEDGLVDVAGGQMAGTVEEVQLITVEAVSTGEGDEDDGQGAGHEVDPPVHRSELGAGPGLLTTVCPGADRLGVDADGHSGLFSDSGTSSGMKAAARR